MGYKTISLSDEAYNKLASMKRKGESFGDVILRLCSKAAKKPLASSAGAWIMSDEEEKQIFGEISELYENMKRVCLATDFLVALLRKNPEAVKKAEEYDSIGAEIATTSMNAFEIYLGAFRSRNAEMNIKQADDLLNSIKLYI